jgi:hypothetical protein
VEPTDDLTTVAFKVCTALGRHGVHAVLTGGSAATVYAPNRYQSRDVDFIARFVARRAVVEEALAAIGYRREGRIYRSERQMVTVDFPDEEILIGSDHVRRFSTLHRDSFVLHVLTPTDSVRDRLCSFFWYRDVSALHAAIGVAQHQAVDLDEIAAWARREGEERQCTEFLARLDSV